MVIQHFMLTLSVLGLMLSGFKLISFRALESGFNPENASTYYFWAQLHIWFGILLGITILYHFLYILFTLYGHSDFLHILPDKNDLKSMLGFGFKKSLSKKGRFGVQEKITYWTIGIYLIFMTVSGILKYSNLFSVNYIPKTMYIYINEFHGAYGLLTGIILTVWHLYSIFLKPGRFPGTLSWWDGKISSAEMNRYQETGGTKSDDSNNNIRDRG